MRADVVDLFCGVGGLSAGFLNEKFRVVAGIDSDGTCKYPYEQNIGTTFLERDVTSLSGDELESFYSEGAVRILVGCAPCQPFSLYTRRYRKDPDHQASDTRWELLSDFARLIEETAPDIVSMENVPRVAVHSVFKEFVSRLQAADYHVSYRKVRAEHYGVPQRRSRLVLLASKFGPIDLILPTHSDRPISVREAIGSLPAIEAGEAHPHDILHRSRGLTTRNLERLRATREGGSWKDWDDSLKLACHKKPGGRSFRAVYGRMKWDEPSPVITTQCLGIGNGRFGHPDQDRAISIREAALLQSFPAHFSFHNPKDKKVNGLRLARQIGNAVPVKLAEAVAKSIRLHLDEIAQHTKPR